MIHSQEFYNNNMLKQNYHFQFQIWESWSNHPIIIIYPSLKDEWPLSLKQITDSSNLKITSTTSESKAKTLNIQLSSSITNDQINDFIDAPDDVQPETSSSSSPSSGLKPLYIALIIVGAVIVVAVVVVVVFIVLKKKKGVQPTSEWTKSWWKEKSQMFLCNTYKSINTFTFYLF